jgi:hypothetical protein
MRQAEFERHVGRENICPDIVTALVRAEVLYLNLQLAGGASGQSRGVNPT